MSLNNLKARINYYGGANQQDRMVKDKLHSLKTALNRSYQAATAIKDGKEFKCLINPDKLSQDLDNKIISTPFDEAIGLKEGDIIEWKENGSHWLVFLQHLEEIAYFRASLRRCRNEIILDNGLRYWAYIRGPVEKNIDWKSASNNYFNKLNHTLLMYIPNTEDTLSYFKRFAKVSLGGKVWEVQATDSISTPGIIEVSLKEYFSNTIEQNIEVAVQESINENEIEEKDGIYIYGPESVFPYESHDYELRGSDEQGIWKIINPSRKNICKLINDHQKKVTVNILTGKSGEFDLIYENTLGVAVAALKIKIKSL